MSVLYTEFDRAEDQAFRELQGVFGQEFTFIPMKSRPNKTPMRDPGRAVFDVCGVFKSTPTMMDIDKNTRIDRAGRGSDMSFNSVSARTLTLNVQKDDLHWVPKAFDRVLQKANGRMFEILNPQGSDHSDIDLRLSEVDGPYDFIG